jgi:hypothetical protein
MTKNEIWIKEMFERKFMYENLFKRKNVLFVMSVIVLYGFVVICNNNFVSYCLYKYFLQTNII